MKTFAVVLIAAFFVIGCSKRPEEKITKVKEQLNYFAQSHSDTVDTKSLIRIVELKNRAKQEIEAQDSRFALFRSYMKGTEMLDSLLFLIENFRDAPAEVPPS